MKRVSSILFALSLIGGAAHADTQYSEVTAQLKYDSTMLQTENGAAKVLRDLETQAERACRKVSLVSVGLAVDEVCAQDVLFQAVDKIGNSNLNDQYAASHYYVKTTSERIQLAAR
ncbi:UrcA family protein [Henriciella sp.]|uniref:UrcA family protein n=1 Tax=Henriciella sp. TaxID=1968823 RepID=UPI0026307829|nr:UrcA family protein [Henriciella sp.]